MMSESSRDAVEEVLRERARQLAVPPAVEAEEPVELLIFSSGHLRLAAATDLVSEVLAPGPTAQLPAGSSALAGLRAVRGGVVALVDPAVLLDSAGDGVAPPEDRFVVVLEDRTAPLGLLVDRVHGVVADARLRPAPQAPLLSALTQDGAVVLDVPALLNDPRTTTHQSDHPANGRDLQ